MTEFRQPLQVQSHLEMPGILVQLGHIQHTYKLAPQIDLQGHLHGASDGTKLYVRYVHATDVTYAKFHARTARTTVAK